MQAVSQGGREAGRHAVMHASMLLFILLCLLFPSPFFSYLSPPSPSFLLPSFPPFFHLFFLSLILSFFFSFFLFWLFFNFSNQGLVLIETSKPLEDRQDNKTTRQQQHDMTAMQYIIYHLSFIITLHYSNYELPVLSFLQKHYTYTYTYT